jgi:hypothetical protein
MSQEKTENHYILAIVAIVAIVAIFVLFLNHTGTSKQGLSQTPSTTPNENVLGQAIGSGQESPPDVTYSDADYQCTNNANTYHVGGDCQSPDYWHTLAEDECVNLGQKLDKIMNYNLC